MLKKEVQTPANPTFIVAFSRFAAPLTFVFTASILVLALAAALPASAKSLDATLAALIYGDVPMPTANIATESSFFRSSALPDRSGSMWTPRRKSGYASLRVSHDACLITHGVTRITIVDAAEPFGFVSKVPVTVSYCTWDAHATLEWYDIRGRKFEVDVDRTARIDFRHDYARPGVWDRPALLECAGADDSCGTF